MHCQLIPFVLTLSSLGVCTGNFLRPTTSDKVQGQNVIAAEEVELNLKKTAEGLLDGRGAVADRIAKIESSLWQTFQSLPKNEMGRLAPRSVRYIVHNYFSKEHGWLIKGLEPHGSHLNSSEVHELTVMQDKAPALVEAMLESRQRDRGLALSDVASMIAVLERMVLDESTALLKDAYGYNGYSLQSKVDKGGLDEILMSYLLLFRRGSITELKSLRAHMLQKRKALTNQGFVDFESDAILNRDFSDRNHVNPFSPRRYAWEETSNIVDSMAENYGKWQNEECLEMKSYLMDLDPLGSGRVPLSTFYAQPKNAAFSFTESADYLRSVGALEESSGGSYVRIVNYMMGPSNCIAHSSYYSVCCLNECESLMNELEHAIQAPVVSPGKLLGLARNISSNSVDAPRDLPQALVASLQTIADRNGGDVPIHGRLFAQWLHYAFPNECPYPQTVENADALTPTHWFETDMAATKSEMSEHMEANQTAFDLNGHLDSAIWSEEEILPLLEPTAKNRGRVSRMVQVALQLSLLLGALRVALSAGHAAMHVFRGKNSKKDDDLWMGSFNA